MPRIKSQIQSIASRIPNAISNVRKAAEVGHDALKCAASGLEFAGKTVHQVLGRLEEFTKSYEKYKNTKNPQEAQKTEELFTAARNALHLADDATLFAMSIGRILQGKDDSHAAVKGSAKGDHHLNSMDQHMIEGNA